jgi:hypothetical protein
MMHQFTGWSKKDLPAKKFWNARKRTMRILLVMSVHGYGPGQKHFVGTTTDKVLAKVSTHLLTVKI